VCINRYYTVYYALYEYDRVYINYFTSLGCVLADISIPNNNASIFICFSLIIELIVLVILIVVSGPLNPTVSMA
jgi:hypothetical protein